MAGKLLFDEGGLKIEDAGERLAITVRRTDHAELTIHVIEGNARRAGLVLRRWVRIRKELRGDTPRGRAAAERRRARAEAVR
jgi:hypothetical protein